MPLLSDVPEYDGRSITLHSTWAGTMMSGFGAVVFLAFAIGMLAVNGAGIVTVALLVAAVFFFVVVLFDLPIAATFRTDGVVRRTLLRHQFLAWDDVTRLRRMRTGIWSRKDGRGGGLLATIGRRKYMLVDTMESAMEFDELRLVLGSEWAEALGLVDDYRPPDDRSPTWLYRRDQWKPESQRKGSQT